MLPFAHMNVGHCAKQKKLGTERWTLHNVAYINSWIQEISIHEVERGVPVAEVWETGGYWKQFSQDGFVLWSTVQPGDN